MEDILNKVNDDFSNYVSLFEKRDSLIPSALTLCPKVVHFIFFQNHNQMGAIELIYVFLVPLLSFVWLCKGLQKICTLQLESIMGALIFTLFIL